MAATIARFACSASAARWTPSELDELDRISQVKAFAPKAMLFEQDALAGSVFNVTEGMVRLYKSLPDGRRQIVGFALPGDFLGLALMDRYSVAAEAVTEVQACRFTRSAFLGYVDGNGRICCGVCTNSPAMN